MVRFQISKKKGKIKKDQHCYWSLNLIYELDIFMISIFRDFQEIKF